MKRTVAILLSVILIISALILPVVAAEKKNDEGFAGSRKVVYTVDKSDLENYLNGGRAFFDLVLRNYAPEWLTYSLKTEGRDLIITLEFTFSTLEEYRNRVSELISENPLISYSKEKSKLFLLEGHTAADMMNFVYKAVAGSMIYETVTVDDIFPVTENVITINGKNYSGGEKLEILPKKESVILLNQLHIKTEHSEDGYKREIRAIPQNGEEAEDLLSRFKKVGDTEENEGFVTVSFSAYSMVELNNLTTRCLYTACNVIEQEKPAKGIRVKVKQTEVFGLDTLMPEYKNFSYSFTYPSYYSKVKGVDETVTVENGTISAENVTSVQYIYEREVAFNKLDIKTDFSNLFGKTKQVITFSAPRGQIASMHEEIKEHFEDYLSRGVALNIYDEGANRYYAFTYSSWFINDVIEFTQDILGNSYEMELSDSWIPYGPSKLYQSINYNRLRVLDTPPAKVTASTVFPAAARFKQTGDASYNAETRTAVLSVVDEDGVTVSYNRFHLIKCIVIFLGLVIILVAVILFKKWWKKIKGPKNKKEPVQSIPAESQPPETAVATPKVEATTVEEEPHTLKENLTVDDAPAETESNI